MTAALRPLPGGSAAAMRGDVGIEPGGAQGPQVRDRRFRAGQDDEIDIAWKRRARLEPNEVERRLGLGNQLGHYAQRQGLAELDAPLVEAVDAPDHALG